MYVTQFIKTMKGYRKGARRGTISFVPFTLIYIYVYIFMYVYDIHKYIYHNLYIFTGNNDDPSERHTLTLVEALIKVE